MNQSDREAVASLVAYALNSLPGTGDDDVPCCAAECAPCATLKRLYLTGQLSDWVRPYVEQTTDPDEVDGWDWWRGTPADGTVRWEWVAARVCVDSENCIAPAHCLSRLPDLEDADAPPE